MRLEAYMVDPTSFVRLWARLLVSSLPKEPRPDISPMLGWETGRDSEPAFMDMCLSMVSPWPSLKDSSLALGHLSLCVRVCENPAGVGGPV